MYTFCVRMVERHCTIFVTERAVLVCLGCRHWLTLLQGFPALWLKGPQVRSMWFLITKGYVGSGTHVQGMLPEWDCSGCGSVLLIAKARECLLYFRSFWDRLLSPGGSSMLYPQVCLQCCFVPIFSWLSHTMCGLFGILLLCFQTVRIAVLVTWQAANRKAMLSQTSQGSHER